MDILANYSFLPFLKTGISTKIQQVDDQTGTAALTSGTNLPRPTISVSVKLNNTVAHTESNVQIIGPGEVLALRADAISKVEPTNNSESLLPNYVAFIEFYDEDLPWRFTPGVHVSGSHKLTPWLTLLVLLESEYTYTKSIDGKLPFIQVNEANLPNPAHLWAFTHVHVSDQVADGTGGNAKIDHIRANDPNRIYSRIVSSRKLDENSKYRAFLVPTFELGRQAGIDPDTQPSTGDVLNWAWSTGSANVELPVYYEWGFSTTDSGDFEELARKLKPRALPSNIGKRKMDIRDMGYGVNTELTLPIQEPQGLGIGGALKAPNSTLLDWDDAGERVQFENHLTTMLNQTTVNQTGGWGSTGSWNITSPDPVVGPPIYGRWHAKYNQIHAGTPPWLKEVNLKPRNRAAAGLGAEIVRKNQEEFMKRAWEQVGDVMAANAIIREAYLALLASQQIHDRCVAPMADDQCIQFTGPAHPRTLVTGTGAGNMKSARTRVVDSNLPAAANSSSMSKIVNRNSKISRRANKVAVAASGNEYQQSLVSNLNSITLPSVTAALPKYDPPNFMSVANQMSAASNLVQNVINNQSLNYAFTTNNGSNGVANYNAFQEFETYFTSAPTVPQASELDLNGTRTEIQTAMDPFTVMVGNVDQVIDQDGNNNTIEVPILCEPIIPIALYEKLKEISSDFIVPNLGNFPDNSVSMLETNREFIESLMVGANHEMARELLWREYPTDQRGTYFPQFWQTLEAPFINYANASSEILDRMDIKRISDWAPNTSLGDSNHRPNASVDSRIVLIVRGELLRKFPNVKVYARPADVRRDVFHETAPNDPNEDLDTDGNSTVVRGFLNHDPSLFKFPVFRAQIDPDTLLLGFDMSAMEAFGALASDTPYPQQPDQNNPITYLGGYYFVFQEREGDIRFGLDIGGAGLEIADWNNVTWGDVEVDNPGDYIDPTTITNVNLSNTPPDSAPDVAWGNSSADAAYVMYQPPVYVAMHATRLLYGLYP